MVYHYSQRLHSTVIKELYKITMHNKAIGTFLWFVSDLTGMDSDKILHKQLIGNWYKYR